MPATTTRNPVLAPLRSEVRKMTQGQALQGGTGDLRIYQANEPGEDR